MDAFAAGEVDIGYIGVPPALLKMISGSPSVHIIAPVDSEGSGIVVGLDSPTLSLRNLSGMTIAVPGESSIQFLLLKIALAGFEIELKPRA